MIWLSLRAWMRSTTSLPEVAVPYRPMRLRIAGRETTGPGRVTPGTRVARQVLERAIWTALGAAARRVGGAGHAG